MITLFGVFVIYLTFRDAFVSILLPRTVRSASRLSNRLNVAMWKVYSGLVKRGSPTEDMRLSLFGPFSIVALIAAWACLLILGFALVVIGVGVTMHGAVPTFGQAFYYSGVTFLTLGYGDLTLDGTLGHALSVIEAGLGFGFLAVVISYLPVLYGSFSRREVLITLMDARAGSPPSGGEMLLRFTADDDWEGLHAWLERWETWAAELLETHLSYPILVAYRSQHSDTSWLCAMTAVMDACVLLLAGMPAEQECRIARRQAHLTFAMCRHAAIDISQVFSVESDGAPERLDRATFDGLATALEGHGLSLGRDDDAWMELARLRGTYEPVVLAMAHQFRLKVPAWVKDPAEKDNWETGMLVSHL